ncbi:MAG: hypothetical protein E7184_00360 [Erysipelotrichaceae bacterium]|nr:hypothetical protein [Erysipelotrichaceae bacterium]
MGNDYLISKIKNMYIMLLYAISKEDIDRVRLHLSDDLASEFEEMINDNIANNVIQKYGELNVASVDIISIKNDLITARIIAKYIDYKIDRVSKNFVSGDKVRSEYEVLLRIRYQKHNEAMVYRCENCGAILDINLTGVCEHCDEPVDDSDSVYVIESIE